MLNIEFDSRVCGNVESKDKSKAKVMYKARNVRFRINTLRRETDSARSIIGRPVKIVNKQGRKHRHGRTKKYGEEMILFLARNRLV